MGIMVYSFLWVVQDLYRQPYDSRFPEDRTRERKVHCTRAGARFRRGRRRAAALTSDTQRKNSAVCTTLSAESG